MIRRHMNSKKIILFILSRENAIDVFVQGIQKNIYFRHR